jgi:hypothetical protein
MRGPAGSGVASAQPAQDPRTATTARCAGVRRAATRPHPPSLPSGLEYRDEVGFEWSELPAHHIRGADYIQAFGLVATSPDAQIGEQEVTSFLLFNRDELNINSLDFYSVVVSGFSPSAGGEATPDLDAIAFLVGQG